MHDMNFRVEYIRPLRGQDGGLFRKSMTEAEKNLHIKNAN